MVKRTIAISFLILSNILILAYSIVPHHHHHNQVCLATSHCEDEYLADEKNSNHHNHSHDGEENSDDCILKEPVVVLTNQLKVDFRFNDKTTNIGLDEFYYCSSDTKIGFLVPVFSRVLKRHYYNSSYSSLVSASLGLRAPPVV